MHIFGIECKLIIIMLYLGDWLTYLDVLLGIGQMNPLVVLA